MNAAGITPKKLLPVYAREGVKASLILVEGRRGCGQGLAIEPPLYLYDSGGTESVRLKGVYSGEHL
jgi:tRNA1(Val) A37 N6-methylase TrmN6